MKKEYQLKKALGQHFLHDENICLQIVDQLQYSLDKSLLEIGPGAGALTKYLLEKPNKAYKVIEIDLEKVTYLNQKYPAIKDKIIHQDFLLSEQPFDESFSIIGNFPYNISSPIMFKILDWRNTVDEVLGMFQKEVAQRIAAAHGTKTYGILSVLFQAYYKVQYLFDVPPQAFTPPPKVMSGVLYCKSLGNPYQIDNFNTFKKFVKLAFSQRRKTLRNALAPIIPQGIKQDEVFNKRAEQLSVQDFVHLYNKIYNS